MELVDTSAEEKLFWSINLNLSELFGILPDLSGGSALGTMVQLEKLQNVVDKYQKALSNLSLVMTVSGSGGVALGAIATYSLTLVTICLGTMCSGNKSKQHRKEFVTLFIPGSVIQT